MYKEGSSQICIDSGLSGILAGRGLKRLGINPEAISHVFLTHTDFDHVGGLKIFKNAEVYISINEEQMINGTTPRALYLKYNKLNRAYKLLHDKEIMEVGEIKVKALDTPGHTPGSMSYLINDSFLFSGDTLTLRNNRVYPFYRLQNMDTERQKETIRRLTEMEDISWLFTAHTGYTKDLSKAVERWR